MKEVDNLTISIETIKGLIENCLKHDNPALAYAVVRYEGWLCNITLPVCHEPECGDDAFRRARELVNSMIEKGQLKVVEI